MDGGGSVQPGEEGPCLQWAGRLARAWTERDPEALAGCFDLDHPRPYYVAEESRSVMQLWNEVRDYWHRSCRAASEILVLDSQHWDCRLSGATWVVAFCLHWEVAPADHSAPIGGDVRVSAVGSEGAKGWRAFHYVEAPMAALVQARMAAEARVEHLR